MRFFQESRLDWRKRPTDVCRRINDAFAKVSNHRGLWPMNGQVVASPVIASIRVRTLLLHQISQQPSQTVFNVLDIGAGDGHGSCTGLASAIELCEDFRVGVKVNFYSLNGGIGEKSGLSKGIRTTITYINTFKIECLTEEFEGCFSQDIKFDLILSKMTFCHLVDPIGTLLQALELLCPNTGYLLSDWLIMDSDTSEIKGQRDLLIGMLHDLNWPYLLNIDRPTLPRDQFILQRFDISPPLYPISIKKA